MAYTAKFVRARMTADALHEREAAAIKRVKEWREVPYERHGKQTHKAVLFPTYGWVPRVAIAGRWPDGKLTTWSQYREGMPFLLAGWFLDKSPAQTRG